VDVTPSKITFAFLPNQKVPRQQCEDMKAFLEDLAEKVAGQRIPVAITVAAAPAAPAAPGAPGAPSAPSAPGHADEAALREEAMADPSVQALFEIFPVEKSKVEEM
jgi:hypothetical protein